MKKMGHPAREVEGIAILLLEGTLFRSALDT